MNLRAHLQQHGISTAQFARMIGVSQNAVLLYLAGKRVPRPGVMRSIVEHTGGVVGPADFYALPAPSHDSETEETT